MEKLPKQFKIGKKSYVVVQRQKSFVYGCALGTFSPDKQAIHIAARQPKKELPVTFWHEVTHAILHHMKHELWEDDRFVEAFAKRLANVIKTAEF